MSCKCKQTDSTVEPILEKRNNPLRFATKACSPVRGICHTEKSGSLGLTADQVESLYGQPRQYTMSDVKSHPFMCSDDRILQPSLYTFGGEIGEFLLALAALDSLQSTKIPLAVIQPLFRGWAVASKVPLTMCFDDASLLTIEKHFSLSSISLVSCT